MIGYASDVDAVNDVVQDIDKLQPTSSGSQRFMIFLTVTSFGKIVLCIGSTHTNSFFLAFGYNLIL